MKKIENDGITLLALDLDEKVDNLSEHLDGVDFIQQNNSLWKVVKNDVFTSLQRPKKDQDEILNKTFKIEPEFDKKYSVYLLKEEWRKLSFPKEDMLYVMKYFKEIFEKHRTEAAVVLLANFETKQWKVLFVPQVNCSHSSVNYLIPKEKNANIPANQQRYYDAVYDDKDGKELMINCLNQFRQLLSEGYTIFGTIHSHCDFSAFHSGIDDADEHGFDGVHVTIGNVNGNWSFSSRVMLNGGDYDRSLEDLFGFTEQELRDSDIDSIKISDFHMKLMMPDLGGYTSTYQHTYSGGSGYGSYVPNHVVPSLWNRDDDTGYNENWYNNSWRNTVKDNDDDDDDEYDDFVFDDDTMIALFDNSHKKYIFVCFSYWINNKEKFPPHTFKRVDFSFVPRKEEKQKRNKGNRSSHLSFLNDPRTNSNYPKGKPFMNGSLTSQKELRRKAKRK